MATTIKLSDEIVDSAKLHGAAVSRSTPKQIEWWARIGKIAEENPDLPYNFIQEILISDEEIKAGKIEPYEFG